MRSATNPTPPTNLALLVEDDPNIRTMLRKLLEHAGLFVVEVATGQRAIKFLAEQTPAIVLLDLMLPESSGFEICAHIRQQRRFDRVPVVIISARLLPEDQAQAQEVGAAAYITKPFKPAHIYSVVKKLLPGLDRK